MKIIELEGISKTYHLEKLDVPVLHDVSLSVEAGEFVVIMGHSGSGKSTLLNILGLLDTPSSGTYRLAGKVVSGMSEDELAGLRNRFMGFVFQQFNLLPRMTARENVSLPLIYADAKRGSEKDAAALLERVGLSDRMEHRPSELSGGQQQRVAVARALINQPLLLFADEPTGNLDSRSTTEIIGILKELNRAGITIIMVTHEPDLAEVAGRVIRVKDGIIVADERKTDTLPETVDSAAAVKHHPVMNTTRVKDYFIQAFRSLIGNKTRALLSILGVLIGVASLIAMMALGTGAQESVKKSISSMGSNLLMIRPAQSSRGGISLESGSVTRFTLQDGAAIKDRVSGITEVVAYVSGRGQAIYNGKNTNTRLEGTSAGYPSIKNAQPARGRFYSEEEVTSRARVAVIGKTVAAALFASEEPLGKYIKINRINFQVIGILPEKGSSGWRDEDDKINIPVTTAMYRLVGREYVDSFDVQVEREDMMDAVSDRIKKLLAALHRLPPSKSDTIDVRNMADLQETITATTKTFSYLLGSIAFVSLLVGGIGIMNIMLVSVSERTREIGLRKAIGANNKDILFQFVIESVAICVLGGLLGIALGTSISMIMAKFAGWNTLVSPSSIGLSFVFSVLTGLVFGVWPARKASLLNPIEALRHE